MDTIEWKYGTTEEFVATEKKAIENANTQDDPESGRKAGWGVYDSPLEKATKDDDTPYSFSFHRVLPPEYSGGQLKLYIEETLAEQRGKIIMLDYGGQGSRVAEGFSPGFLARSAGICLSDTRSPEQKIRDEENNHTIITGDMFSAETRVLVEEWLHGDKAGIILQRMFGRPLNGLVSLSLFPELRTWYQQLGDGIILEQLPGGTSSFMEQWTDKVNRNFPGVLEAQYDSTAKAALRLRKLPGAPEKLPVEPVDIRQLKASVQARFRS